MTTTKATMIGITKHETHSYYVIILTFNTIVSNHIESRKLCTGAYQIQQH